MTSVENCELRAGIGDFVSLDESNMASEACESLAAEIGASEGWIARPLVRRLTTLTMIVVAGGYLGFLFMFLFAQERVTTLVGKLNLVEPERIVAKAGNILFGMTFIFIVWLAITIFERKMDKKFEKPVFHSLLNFKRLEKSDPGWFSPLCIVFTIVGMLFVPLFFLHAKVGMKWLFLEDGPVEYATALGFLIASVIFVRHAWPLLVQKQIVIPYKRFLSISFLLIGVLCFFVCMEEISWGQRIIGIETPEVLSTINTQNEINLHNLFTDYFNQAYFVIGCVFIVFNLVAMYCREAYADKFWVKFMPHPMLLVLAGLIASFSFHLEVNELVEPIAVLYVIAYALQIGVVLSQQISRSTQPQSG